MLRKKTTSGDWWFRGAATLTVVWISFLVLLSIFRGPDYWPLFAPKTVDPNSTHLSLNEIGDFLSGSFAPLAFLWFFVSTWLQREELKETRQILADQQAELQRSAKESAEQTEIMQAQLETAQSRETFEEHRLRMYYLAKLIDERLDGIYLECIAEGKTIRYRFYIQSEPGESPNESNQSVDAAFKRLRMRLERNFSESFGVLKTESIVNQSSLDNLYSEFAYISGEMDLLVNTESYRNNKLISARLNGTGFRPLLNVVCATRERLREWNLAKATAHL